MKKQILSLMALLCAGASTILVADAFIVKSDAQDNPRELMDFEENLIQSGIYRKSNQFLELTPILVVDEQEGTISIIFNFPGIDRSGTSVEVQQDMIIGTMAATDGWYINTVENTCHLTPKGGEEFQGVITIEIDQNTIQLSKKILYDKIAFTGERTRVEAGEDRPILLPVAIDTGSAHIQITDDRVIITCNLLIESMYRVTIIQ